MSALPSRQPFALNLKLRPDLEWSKFTEEIHPTWVARNPVSLEYFYFSDLEKQLLFLLDGKRTLQEVLNDSSSSIEPQWLANLVAKAQAANLLIGYDLSNIGAAVWKVQRRIRNRAKIQWLLSPLAIRFKLFDPTQLLEILSPLSRFLFSKSLFALWLITTPVIIYFVILELLQSGRGTLVGDAFGQLNSERILMMLLMYAIIKSLHELGHALACRKWNAECHEIGVFFLVFAPCLYCDTSDCWKLNNHWRRAAIAAAGIYIEVLIATLAGIVWLLTQPGSGLHWVAAYAMVIGSFSTVLVNANPLLRYDGYYILSDLWRVPNLADQSREALRALFARWMTGIPMRPDRWDASPWGLILYQITAKIYRTFLLFFIIGIVWVMLDRIGLRLIGILLVGLTLTTAMAGTIWGTLSMVREISMTGKIRALRALALVSCAGVLIWAALNIRWPTYVTSRAISQLASMSPVYARQTGQLVSFSPLGQVVAEGTQLVQLKSKELVLEAQMVQGTIAQLEEKLVQLRMAQVDDDRAAFELGNVVEQIAMNQARQKILEDEIDALQVVSQHAGKLIPADSHPQIALAESDHLGIWNPILSPAHIGATIERGTLLGWLARADTYDLTAFVSEHDARRLYPGMEVVCRWDCQVARLYRGKVTRIAPEPLDSIPPPLVGDASFLMKTDTEGRASATPGHYEVLIAMTEYPSTVSHHSLATVHFETAPNTLGEMAYRFYSINVRPRLVSQNR